MKNKKLRGLLTCLLAFTLLCNSTLSIFAEGLPSTLEEIVNQENPIETPVVEDEVIEEDANKEIEDANKEEGIEPILPSDNSNLNTPVEPSEPVEMVDVTFEISEGSIVQEGGDALGYLNGGIDPITVTVPVGTKIKDAGVEFTGAKYGWLSNMYEGPKLTDLSNDIKVENIPDHVITKSITYYVVFSGEHSFDFNFKVREGDEKYGEINKTYARIKEFDKISSAGVTATAKPGYKFVGWYFPKDPYVPFETKVDFEKTQSELSIRNLTFEARFEVDNTIENVDVTFEIDPGSIIQNGTDALGYLNGDIKPITVTVKKGTTIYDAGVKFDAAENGILYSFIKGKVESDRSNEVLAADAHNHQITESATYYVVYAGTHTFNINFKVRDGDELLGNVNMTSARIKRGELISTSGIEATAKPGAKFVGWFIPKDIYIPFDKEVNFEQLKADEVTHNVTYEARFVADDSAILPEPELKNFIVTFTVRDGDNELGNISNEQTTIIENEVLGNEAAKATPNTGATFLGWFKNNVRIESLSSEVITDHVSYEARFEKQETVTPDPTPNPDPTPDPNPTPDPKPDPTPNPTPDPKPTPRPEPEVKPTPEQPVEPNTPVVPVTPVTPETPVVPVLPETNEPVVNPTPVTPTPITPTPVTPEVRDDETVVTPDADEKEEDVQKPDFGQDVQKPEFGHEDGNCILHWIILLIALLVAAYTIFKNRENKKELEKLSKSLN